MAKEAQLELELQTRTVTLEHPGAQGVVFEDAVAAVRNVGREPECGLRLGLKVEQQGKGCLFDGEVALPGGDAVLAPDGEWSVSLFRLLQEQNRGFASRVHLFGYRAAVGWDFRVVASLWADSSASVPVVECHRGFRWEAEGDPPRGVLHWAADEVRPATGGGTLTVKFFGCLHTLRRQQGLPAVAQVSVPADGVSAVDLAQGLELPLEKIEAVFCNHKTYGMEHRLRAGDAVAFVPAGTPGPHRFTLGIYGAGRGTGRTD